MRVISLVLSGQICRPNTANLLPFWKGYIELQNKLPAACEIDAVYSHSWNPEYANLVDLVYNCKLQVHEHQPSFHYHFIEKIRPATYFESGLRRKKSTWHNVSLQSIMGNAASRSRAMALINSDSKGQRNTLITRWDLGQTGQAEVNNLVYDIDLPCENIYLSHFSEVDEGYADMWIYGDQGKLSALSEFEDFCVASLTGANNYLRDFTEIGWPKSIAKRHLRFVPNRWRNLTRIIKKKLKARIVRMLLAVSRSMISVGFINKVTSKALNSLYPPLRSGEISRSKGRNKLRTYPRYAALNIHALLKYFFLERELRDSTIFLDKDDFANAETRGCLINPEEVIVVIENDQEITKVDHVDGKALPFPVGKIIIKGDGKYKVLTKTSQNNNYLLADSFSEHVYGLVDLIAHLGHSEASNLILVNSFIDLQSIKNHAYLNALLKFTRFNYIEFIPFLMLDDSADWYLFPGLQYGKVSDTILFDVAIIRADCYYKYINVVAGYDGADAVVKKFPDSFVYRCDRSRLFKDFT